MKEQIKLFLKYFLSIQNGTNKDINKSKIVSIDFNPEFYRALVKQQYLNKSDTNFRGYPFKIDFDKGADYWGIMLEPIVHK